MTIQERDLLAKYFYFAEERLIQAINDCTYRYTRRDLESIDLLEEIIAKERLKAFNDFQYDVRRLLHLEEQFVPEITVREKKQSPDSDEFFKRIV